MREHLTDAGRLIVPRRDDPHGPLPPLLLVLTVVTGLVDAFSFLTLGRVLVANMTGNVIFSGFALGGAAGFIWWALLVAVAAFLVGAWIGGRLCLRIGAHRGRHIFGTIVLELVFLSAAWLLCLVVSPPYRDWPLVALIVLLGIGMPLSLFTVILGHVLAATPYAIAVLNAAFSSLDKSFEEAAYDLGETKLNTFRLITLPLVMPGIISSFLMAFTISLDEFIIAFFLAGEQTTLPTYIFSQLRFPKQIPMIMALGTMLVLLSVILLTIAEYFRRRGIAKTGAKDSGGFL